MGRKTERNEMKSGVKEREQSEKSIFNKKKSLRRFGEKTKRKRKCLMKKS